MIGSIVEDRYLVEEELGNGAMGRVFAARHVKVGRRVAIKVMHEELAQNAAVVERFAREAMIAAKLRHPNLVSVLDVGQTASHQPLLVLELAPGVPLTELASDALPGPRVINIIRQLLRGLSHAHAAGLIHRDLKPDNILVETTHDGTEIPRIVDFGIAVTADRDDTTVAGRRLTDANMVIGTPFYMSPEQARAKAVDHRSDLFSLGVIMYELLAGMPPFSGSSVEVALANASKEPPTIAERAGIAVDPLLEAFMRRLMARRVEHRFQSAREALDVLALIEIDRMAAARVLGGAPLLEMPRPVFAEGSGPNMMPQPPVAEIGASTSTSSVVDLLAEGREAPALLAPTVRPNSDAMTTLTEAPADTDDATAPISDDANDDLGELDYNPAASLRRRKRFALGFLAAAITAAAALFVLQQPPRAEAPRVEVGSQDGAEHISIKPASLHTSASAVELVKDPATVPPQAVPPTETPRTTVAPQVTQSTPPAALARSVTANPRTTHKIVATQPVQAVMQPAQQIVQPGQEVANLERANHDPAVADAVAEHDVKVDPSGVDALVAKYQAVAKKLKAAPTSPTTDDLWMRFRLIRINESIATSQSRHQALALLSAIEKAM